MHTYLHTRGYALEVRCCIHNIMAALVVHRAVLSFGAFSSVSLSFNLTQAGSRDQAGWQNNT